MCIIRIRYYYYKIFQSVSWCEKVKKKKTLNLKALSHLCHGLNNDNNILLLLFPRSNYTYIMQSYN